MGKERKSLIGCENNLGISLWILNNWVNISSISLEVEDCRLKGSLKRQTPLLVLAGGVRKVSSDQ